MIQLISLASRVSPQQWSFSDGTAVLILHHQPFRYLVYDTIEKMTEVIEEGWIREIVVVKRFIHCTHGVLVTVRHDHISNTVTDSQLKLFVLLIFHFSPSASLSFTIPYSQTEQFRLYCQQ